MSGIKARLAGEPYSTEEGVFALVRFAPNRSLNDINSFMQEENALLGVTRLVELPDRPPVPGENNKETKPAGGGIVRWLGIRCSEPKFWAFLMSAFPNLTSDIRSDAGAAYCVRMVLSIDSRGEIDKSRELSLKTKELIMMPWAKYCENH